MRIRRPHRLVTAKRLRFVDSFIAVDTETTTLEDGETSHNPSLKVGFCEFVKLDSDLNPVYTKSHLFYTPHSFWEFVESMFRQTSDITIYAHNWSFDFPVLSGFIHLNTMGFELKSIVDASPPIILKFRRDKQKLSVIDTLNYFTSTLASLGESIGVPKMVCDVTTATVDELIPYCKNDVKIVRDAMIFLMRFLLKHDLTGLRNTKSAISLATYVRKFNKTPIYIDGNAARVSVGRDSYFGGRTEAFRLGEWNEPMYLIDVNSQYPFIMRQHEFPFKAIGHWKRITLTDIEQLLERYAITLRCTLVTDHNAYPYKINNRTCFPVGEFSTVLSTPEVEYALAYGHITTVHEVVCYEKANLFTDFVDFFYHQRLRAKKEGSSAEALFLKYILNSLSGKFGQRGQEWVDIGSDDPLKPCRWSVYDAVEGRRTPYMSIGGRRFESITTPEADDSFPAIAAHVTAYGRLMIQNMRLFLGCENVYYCDTDSVIINQTGYDKIKDRTHSSRLGCWGLEKSVDYLRIHGVKDYVLGEKVKIKGVKRKAVKISQNLYEQLQFSSLKYNIRTGDLTTPVIKMVRKQLTREYTKGVVLPSGEIRPYTLPLEEDGSTTSS